MGVRDSMRFVHRVLKTWRLLLLGLVMVVAIDSFAEPLGTNILMLLGD
jgi:hypothetical protein